MSRTLFVAGTDTGVGKTFVAERLIAALVHRGLRVVGMKPAETGCDDSRNDELDGDRLRHAANVDAPLERTCPYRLAWPASPLAAAQREGTNIDVDVILQAAAALRESADVLVIEGAGGLLVPLTPHADVIDLAIDLEATVVLVARSGLGTINHTLLACEALFGRDVDVAGVVLNRVELDVDRELETSNVTYLRHCLPVPCWGPVPRDVDATDFGQLIDVDALVGER